MARNKKLILILLAGVFLFSLAGLCSKLAARHPVLSAHFWGYYGLALLIMAVYAVLWQQMLRRLSLVTAYACRGTAAIWAMVWGISVFGESFRFRLLVAAVLIVSGIGLVIHDDG